MNFRSLLEGETIGDFVRALGIALGILLTIAIIYFYIYLPGSTNHGALMEVPDFLGMPSENLDSAAEASNLRFEVNDSSFNADFGPLEISRQFPAPGSMVKPGRKIFVSINRTDPPTVPVPELIDVSLINASAILVSNGLKPGRIIYEPSPFADLVISMAIRGRAVKNGARVPRGTPIDLIVGDGAGARDFVVNNLVGMSLEKAMVLISNWNLHLGDVYVPEDADTTGTESFVFRQKPSAGDSVRLGDPVHLWIAPKDYTPPPDSIEIENIF